MALHDIGTLSRTLRDAADEIERLRAALEKARAEERERCARVAEQFAERSYKKVEAADTDRLLDSASGAVYAANSIAAAIRGLE